MEEGLIVHPDGSATLSRDRLLLCLEIAWELDALGYLLPSVTTSHDLESRATCLAVRGFSARFVQLAGALMAAVDDNGVPLSSLTSQVFVTPLEVEGA